MNDPSLQTGDNPELNAAIVEWFALVERQSDLDPEEFIGKHPNCAAELREFFADVKGFRQAAENFGEALGPSSVSQSLERKLTVLEGPFASNTDFCGSNSFGTFELQHVIAQGGMGVVFKARDKDLKRDIAVKVLLEQYQGESAIVERFVEEAEIAGQLQHPGITPVYVRGKFPDQRPYFAMKLVKGETLTHLLANRSNPQEDRPKFLKIFEQICQTLAYAHSRGVIHRDLKPSNIMVGAFDEVQVMDWGLAKVLTKNGVSQSISPNDSEIRTGRSDASGSSTDSGSQTQAGSVIGTWAYMPPEQAMGEINLLDQRSDVFGLGAVLCEILTGNPPYVTANPAQLRRKAISSDLVDAYARLELCDADEELKHLAKSALAPDPADRPADAGILAQELTKYREGVETRLRQAELAEVQATTRAAEERARRKLTLVFMTAVLTVLAIGVIGVTWGLLRAQLALKAEHRAKEDLRRELYVADLQLAGQIWESENGTAKQVAALLSGHIPVNRQSDLREFAWRLQWTALHRNSLVLKGQGQTIKLVAFTTDGRLLTLDEDLMLRCRNLADGAISSELKILGASQVSCWSISADARKIALGSVDRVQVFDTQTGERLCEVSGQALVLAQSISADGHLLATAWGNGQVQVWKIEDGEESASHLLQFPNQTSALDRIEFSPDGQSLFLLDYPDSSQVTRIVVGQSELLCPTGHQSSVYSIAFSLDGKRRATGDSNGQICLSDNVIEGHDESILAVHHGPVSALCFSDDGHWLATGGVDGGVTVWDVQLRKQVRTLKGHEGRINSLSFARDGLTVVSAGEDGVTRVWNLHSNGPSRPVGIHELPVFCLAYSPDGARIAVGTGSGDSSQGGLVKIWDAHSSKLMTTFTATEGRVLALAYSKDGKYLITGGYDSNLVVWDSVAGTKLFTMPGLNSDPPLHFRQSAIGTMAISPDGKSVVVGFGHPTFHQSDYAQVAKIFELTTGKLIKTLEGHTNTVCEVAYSPDGKVLATASDDRRVILWSTEDWKILQTLQGTDRFKAVTFSANSQQIVAGDARGTVTIWESISGRCVNRLRGHASAVYRIAFSPDNRTLATASWDHTIKLWDPVSGRETRTLHGHKEWISCLAFAPDGGNALATGSFDHTVRLWEAATIPEISEELKESQVLADQSELKRRVQLNERSTRMVKPMTKEDLTSYVGRYNDGLIVEIEADHLTIRPVEGRAGVPVRLYPQSDFGFFARDYNLDVTFLKDHQGNVARVVICLDGKAHEVLPIRMPKR